MTPTPQTSALVTVRLTARASREELSGWVDGVLQARVRAAPVDGKANDALHGLLARALSVPPSRIALISGETARIKRFRVEGLALEEVIRRLG